MGCSLNSIQWTLGGLINYFIWLFKNINPPRETKSIMIKSYYISLNSHFDGKRIKYI